MAITFLQGATGPANTGSPDPVTFTGVTAGQTSVVCLSQNYRSTPPSVLDSQGNSYVALTPVQILGNVYFYVFAAPVASSGSLTVTVSFSAGNSRCSFFSIWSGLSQTFDGASVNVNTTNSSTSGSMTTTTAGDLILQMYFSDTTSTWTPTNGGTTRLTNSANDILATRIQSSAGSIASTATGVGIGATYKGYGCQVALKAASSGIANTKNVSEAISLSSILLKTASKSQSDSVSLVSTWANQTAKLLSSPITLAESFIKNLGKSASDSITTLESLVKGLSKAPFLENISASDLIFKNPAKAVFEAFSLISVLGATSTRVRAFVESFSIGESISTAAARIRSFSESFSLSDLLSSTKVKLIALADSLGITESFSASASRVRSFVESISIGEAISTAASRVRAFSDSFSLNDLLSVIRSKLLALSDIFLLSEHLSSTRAKLLQMIDAFGISDGLTKASQFVYVESVSLLDAISAVRGKLLSLIDSISVADLLSSTKAKLISFVENGLVVTDNITRSIRIKVSELFSLTDLLIRGGGKLLTLIDSLAVTEGLRKQVSAVHTEVMISLSDSITKALIRRFLEALSIIDAISTALHGLGAVVRKFAAVHIQRLWIVQKVIRLWNA